METWEKIINDINKIKEYNIEAGNILHDQMHCAQNARFSFDELSDYLKEDDDVADLYFSDNEELHKEVRDIQDSIITFYAFWE